MKYEPQTPRTRHKCLKPQIIFTESFATAMNLKGDSLKDTKRGACQWYLINPNFKTVTEYLMNT